MDSIKHPFTLLYYFGSIFPFLSVIVSWIIFYSMGHHTPGLVLTISETMCPFPEKRIFACTMNVEAIVLFVLFYVRITFIKLQGENANKVHELPFIILTFVLNICWIVVPLGLTVLAAVTLDDGQWPHLIAAGFFFLGSVVFYIVSDFAINYVKGHVPFWSILVSWVTLGFMVIYFLTLSIGSNTALTNTGAVFQYLTALSIFAKIFIFQYDIPKHKLTVGK